MGAFLGISLWVALATVVPGLVTIASLYGAAVIVSPGCLGQYLGGGPIGSDWVYAGLAVTAMVLTQAIGILLEGVLISKRWLGPEKLDLEIPAGIDPHGETSITLQPYFEYDGLYILLSELEEKEDAQGHLKRALAQFFLTNNTLVSFGLGIIFAVLLAALCPSWPALARMGLCIGLLGLCLALSYKVAVIRFGVMAKSLWAARRRRHRSAASSSSESA